MRANTLAARQITARVEAKRQYTNWAAMTDPELIREGSRQCQEKGICSKNQAKDRHSGFFRAVQKRENSPEIWNRIEFAKRAATLRVVPMTETIIRSPPKPAPQEITINEPQGEEPVIRPTERIIGTWDFKTTEQILKMANSFVSEKGISSMHELKRADRPLWRVIRKRNIAHRVEFPEKTDPEPKSGVQSVRPAKVKKEKQTMDEEKMYRRLADRFHLGSGKAFIGANRITMEKIFSGLNLSKHDFRTLSRCWRNLERTGAINYNSSKTAASLVLKNIEGDAREALSGMIERETAVR